MIACVSSLQELQQQKMCFLAIRCPEIFFFKLHFHPLNDRPKW